MIDVSIKPGYDKIPIAEYFMGLIADILSEDGKKDGKKINNILDEKGGEVGSKGFLLRTLKAIRAKVARRSRKKDVWEIDLTDIQKIDFDLDSIRV